MLVIEHKISQSINLTQGVKVAERTELEKRLVALKTAINTELANRGLAILELAYNPEKEAYHYCVPASYNEMDYLFIKSVVTRHCRDRL